MKADLHCHTKLSDGSLGIEEIIQLAKKIELDTISITDHDCMAGTVRAKIIGERNGIKVIQGVEISATDMLENKQVHILAYKCDSPDRLEGLCKKNLTARKRAGQYMMIKAAAKYPINADLVLKWASGSTNLYKQHIMVALMECGYTSEIYGELYNELFHPDSPDNIIVTPKFTPVEEVIEMIHAADGIAVMAHPNLYDNFELIDRLIPLGLDGIEVWHPTCTPEAEERLIAKAQSGGLLMTGGSDFHGIYNHGKILLGDYLTPKKQFDELMNYKTRKKRRQRKEEAQAVQELGVRG